jgi:chromate transporter
MYSVASLTPGLSLFALTTQIGWQLQRQRGILVSMLGLVIPSVSITVLFTALYASIRTLPLTQAAIRGIFAAVFGITLAVDWRIVKPLLTSGYRRGGAPFAVALAILVGSGLLYAVFRLPVVLIYAIGMFVGAVAAWQFRNRSGYAEH